MARADLLLSMVKAGTQENSALFRATVEALIAEERAKQHHVLADQLSAAVRSPIKSLRSTKEIPGQGLVIDIIPSRRLTDLILTSSVLTLCSELIEEQSRADLLRSYGVEPRHTVLAIGPPGNGKTSLAEAIAESLALPLYVARYEGIIGSYLGETANRLGQLFDFIRQRPCVLLLDEFDTIAKERSDPHDSGEIKRVVSSLLLQIDRLPSYVIIVATSNHQSLIDSAAWRRFQIRIRLDPPSAEDVLHWLKLFEARSAITFTRQRQSIADAFAGTSFAELEQFALDVVRRRILSDATISLTETIRLRMRLWHEQQSWQSEDGE